jgi:hypothetical protein
MKAARGIVLGSTIGLGLWLVIGLVLVLACCARPCLRAGYSNGCPPGESR